MNAGSKRQTGESVETYVALAVEIFAMLADATRVRLILALSEEELSVNRLAEIVEKSPTAVSQHLAKLRLARMVNTRRAGQTIYYSLADEHAQSLVVNAIHQAEHSLNGRSAPHHLAGESRS